MKVTELQNRMAALQRHLDPEPQEQLDPVSWVAERLGLTLDQWQKDLLLADPHRLLLLTPRQSGKSTTVGALAAVRMVDRPGSRVVVLSPSQRQSTLLTAKVLDCLRDESLERESAQVVAHVNGSVLHSLPGDRPATVRGVTADLVIVDEASRVRDELIAACFPMVASTDGGLMMLSTPAGQSGQFYSAWIDETGEWQKVRVSLADVSHYSPGVLKTMRRRLGPRVFSQEFENVFLDLPGALFSGDVLDRLFSRPDPIKPDETWAPLGAQTEEWTPL